MVSCLLFVGSLSAGVGEGEDREALATLQRLADELSKRTLGGVQFWTDELVFREWRIQQNVLSGHYRLLDGDNRRHVSGTFQQCRERLEQIKQEQSLELIRGRVLVVLHGLAGHRGNVSGLCEFVAKDTDLTPISVGYASTRGTLDSHAAALAKVIEHLGPDVTEINFIGYSMGNVVIRRYLHDHPDQRIKRFAMIAPPNHGVERATKWNDNTVFLSVVGGAAHQLGAGWKSTAGKLAKPQCEFGIIAGGRENDEGFSADVPGDDDWLISVDTTRLAGAADFTIVPMIHQMLPFDTRVRERCRRFIEHGYFVDQDSRQPIDQDGKP